MSKPFDISQATPTADYTLLIHGDSMEPTIPYGSVVVVDPDTPATPGKIVIVRQNPEGEATIHRLELDGGRYYLRADNPRYPVLEMAEDAVICGVVRRLLVDLPSVASGVAL